MSFNSRLVYTSTTPTARGAYTGEVSRIGTEATVGYIPPSYGSRRAVVYLSDKIHLDAVWNDSVDLDTMFGFDDLAQYPFALGGEASEETCEVVRVVSKHTPIPYDYYHGIRVSRSDKPQYASKIVFLLSSGTNLRQVCDEVAEAVFGHGVPFASSLHDSDRESDKERESILAYSCIDYSY
jgi:hypothetical protein